MFYYQKAAAIAVRSKKNPHEYLPAVFSLCVTIAYLNADDSSDSEPLIKIAKKVSSKAAKKPPSVPPTSPDTKEKGKIMFSLWPHSGD